MFDTGPKMWWLRPIEEHRANRPAMTRQEAEDRALLDYAKYRGRLLRVNTILGYYSESDSGCWDCDLVVKVVATDYPSILHWNDEWLDPYWDVKIISGKLPHPDLRSAWIDGPSINTLTGETTWKHIVPLTRWERLLNFFRRTA